MDLISRENWLPVASPDLINKKALRNSIYPNIYISLHEDELKMDIGLVFNTVNSIDKIRNILTPYSTKEKTGLVQLLQEFGKMYVTQVYRKIQDHHQFQTPYYKPVLKIPTSKIDDEFIERMFKLIIQLREEGKEKFRHARVQRKFYRESPTITLAEITIDLDEDEYREKIGELTGILKVCIGVKTDAEIKIIKKEETERIKKRLDELEKERIRLIERYYTASTEEASKILPQINQIEREINSLKSAER